MNEQTPNEFTNEQYATFDQYLEEQIKRLKVSIDREVPESGPFKEASVVVGSGTNQELRTLINEPAFIDTLNNAYAQLLEIAEENT